MKTEIQHYLVRHDKNQWQPLIEKGIHYPGIWVRSLRFNEEQGRSATILLKFDPGAGYPYHNHPAGEEIYVLSGEAVIENETLSAGDYLYTPPGFKHAVHSLTGCVLFFVIPEEVEIL